MKNTNTRDKIISLQHDAHNLLDRIDNQQRMLEKWLPKFTECTKNIEPKLPSSSIPYVVNEYIKTHVKEMRAIINAFYELSKNQQP